MAAKRKGCVQEECIVYSTFISQLTRLCYSLHLCSPWRHVLLCTSWGRMLLLLLLLAPLEAPRYLALHPRDPSAVSECRAPQFGPPGLRLRCLPGGTLLTPRSRSRQKKQIGMERQQREAPRHELEASSARFHGTGKAWTA